MSQIEIIYQGEIVDETAIQKFDPNDVYDAVSARIVELQNENYADREAATLLDWLGDFVVRVYCGVK